MSTSLSRKPRRPQEGVYSIKRAAAGKKGQAAVIASYGERYWQERLAKGTAVHEQRAAMGAYRVGESPTFDFALSHQQKALLLATAADLGVSAAELCRACLTRALPQVVRVKKRAKDDQQALTRFREKIVSDSRQEWGGGDPPSKPAAPKAKR